MFVVYVVQICSCNQEISSDWLVSKKECRFVFLEIIVVMFQEIRKVFFKQKFDFLVFYFTCSKLSTVKMGEVIGVSVGDSIASQLVNWISWVISVLSSQISKDRHTLSKFFLTNLKSWNLGSWHGRLKCRPLIECNSVIGVFNTSKMQDLSCCFTSAINAEIM